jgi:hypothetical protein
MLSLKDAKNTVLYHVVCNLEGKLPRAGQGDVDVASPSDKKSFWGRKVDMKKPPCARNAAGSVWTRSSCS